MDELLTTLLSSGALQNSPFLIVAICCSIAFYFGAKGLFAVLQEINKSLATIHSTLQVLVEQSAATNKILGNEIDRLLNMIDNQLRK